MVEGSDSPDDLEFGAFDRSSLSPCNITASAVY
jgi:hypothetical protein